MDNQDTTACVEDVIESIENVFTDEEILCISPRDIKKTVISWAKEETDIERAIHLVKLWLAEFEERSSLKVKDTHYTREEKFELLRKTLLHTERDLKESYKQIPIFSKCDLSEFIENMKVILDNIHSLNDNNKTRFLKILSDTGYNFTSEFDYYPYLRFFLNEVIWLECYIHCEINPNIKQLEHLNQAFHPNEKLNEILSDKQLIKRLEFYRKVGVRNKYPYAATKNSEKWNISFEDFAKLYRKIFSLTNKAISSPHHLS